MVTVRLPDELHRAVKVKAAERGDSLEGIGRAAYVAYLGRADGEAGSPLERAGVAPREAAAELEVSGPASHLHVGLAPFDPECRNAGYHREGRACRFCGGAR